MLRSVLIGIDNTPSGIAAQELGVRWAKRFDARLTGITIIDDPDVELSEELVFAGIHEAAVGRALVVTARPVVREGLGQVENHFGQRCREAGVDFKRIRDFGSPHVQVLVEAQNHDVALLGRHFCFEFGGGRKLGHMVGKVIQDCPRPLVIVPAEAVVGDSIVVAYDGSLQAARALMAFEASGLARGARGPRPRDRCRPPGRNPARRAGRRFSLEPRDRCHSSDRGNVTPTCPVDPREHTKPGGRPTRHGCVRPAGLREFFVGSVTRTMLNESPVPIFCFH